MKPVFKWILIFITLPTLMIVVYGIGFSEGYIKGASGEVRIARSTSRIMLKGARLIDCGEGAAAGGKLQDAGEFYEFYASQAVSDLSKVTASWILSDPSFFLPIDSAEIGDESSDQNSRDNIDCKVDTVE